MNLKNACHIYNLAEVKLNKIMSIKLNPSGHPYPINKARKPYCTKRTAPFQKRTDPRNWCSSTFQGLHFYSWFSKQTYFYNVNYFVFIYKESNKMLGNIQYSGFFNIILNLYFLENPMQKKPLPITHEIPSEEILLQLLEFFGLVLTHNTCCSTMFTTITSKRRANVCKEYVCFVSAVYVFEIFRDISHF